MAVGLTSWAAAPGHNFSLNGIMLYVSEKSLLDYYYGIPDS